MQIADSSRTAAARAELLDVALELGFLSRQQAEQVQARDKQLRRGRLDVSLTQSLLELKLLDPSQLRTLADELDMRHARATAPRVEPPNVLLFGKFEVLQTLHANGYTRVYHARDAVSGLPVVLKVLPKGLPKQSQWFERFRREMFLAGNLAHPNIVSVRECGAAEDTPYIAFEYLEGPSLARRLEREGNLPEKTAWLIAREVAKGLACIEEFGILHRDIKPDNILCALNGRVKIIDLGLSKSLMDAGVITATGETVGTPFYMSPEQAAGTKGLDSRTDIYALGCTAYHMLCGSVPFIAEDAVEVMVRHGSAPRPNPRDIVPELSSGSASLVMWMMAVRPEDRPDTARRLVDAIDALLPALPEPRSSSRSVLQIVPS